MSERKQHEGERLTRREALGGLIGFGVSVPLLKAHAADRGAPSEGGVMNPAVQNMVAAASAFLNALTPRLRERAVIPFDDFEERSNWHFFPTKSGSEITWLYLRQPSGWSRHKHIITLNH